MFAKIARGFLATLLVAAPPALALSPQTITFGTVADQVVGAAPFVLSATASSGLDVAFSSLTPATCTVSGVRLTAVAAGTCLVRAAQAGSATFSAAPNVDRALNVTMMAAGPSLELPVDYAVGAYPEAVTAGDFNGDGRVDLAVANWSDSSVSILLGRGDGTFLPAATYPVGVAPMSIVAADFNGDGKVDLATANLLGQNVSVVLGRGDGTFGGATSIAVGVALFGIAAADLNGDGKIDLAVTNGSSGGVVGQAVCLLLGNGAGGFQIVGMLPTAPNPKAVAIRDLNGDGRPDVVTANADANSVSVFLNAGGGSFAGGASYAVGWSPEGVALADVNGDGFPDLVVANTTSYSVSVLLNHRDGTFAAATNAPAGSTPGSPVVIDLDEDGRVDVVVVNELQDTITVLGGNGDGTFRSGVAYGVLAHPLGMTAVDVNGDGRGDLVVAASGANAASVMLRKGAAPTYVVSVASGSPQSTVVGTRYTVPLTVNVRDGAGRPQAGVTVTFTAPAAGASAAFVTGRTALAISDALGIATASALTANATIGAFAVTATVGSATTSFALTNTAAAGAAPAFTSAPPPNGTYGLSYGFTVAATGSPAPTFSVVPGALPPGLALDGVTGRLAGTPTLAGIYSSAISARNGIAPDASQTFAITIAPQAQTITFAALPDVSAQSVSVTLAASSSAGLPVSFASLTPAVCGVNGTTATLLATGTCSVRASQAGNANIAAAVPVDRTFVVAKAAQTVAFTTMGPQYLDGGPGSLVATASSGLAVTFTTLTPSTCIVSGGLVFALTPGTCSIRASQAGNARFAAAPSVDQSFAIARAFQSLSFAPIATKAMSASPVALSAAAQSGSAVVFTSQTPGVCSVSGAQAILLTAGTCTIQAAQAGTAQFAAAKPVARSFTVVWTMSPPAALPPSPPLLEFVRRLGGSSGMDRVLDVAVRSDGGSYGVGSVASTDVPGISASQFTNAGLDLLSVASLDPFGAQLAARPVGGRSARLLSSGAATAAASDEVLASALDTAGNLYMAIHAYAVDLPQRAGAYGQPGAKQVVRTNGTTIQVIALGLDPAITTIRAMAVDAAGNIYLTGRAAAGLRTSAGAAVATAAQGGPFVQKLDAAGAMVYATYLGTTGTRPSSAPSAGQSTWDTLTTGYALAVDGSGNAYVAGQAAAADLPSTAGSPDTADLHNRDAFVAKLSANGGALLYVARLGGADAERATSVALAPDGTVLVAGKTATYPFQGSANAFQRSVTFTSGTPLVDRETGFLARLAADGTSWLAVAAVGSQGGNLVDGAADAAAPLIARVDSAGNVFVAGTTHPNRILPTSQNLAGREQYGAFVMKVAPDLTRLAYSSTLGFGVATGLAVDTYGAVYLAGYDSGGFVAKLASAAAPLVLTAANPVRAGTPATLLVTLADARFTGSVELRTDEQLVATVPLQAGTASITTSFAPGAHRVRATFKGAGPLADAMAEIVLTVTQ